MTHVSLLSIVSCITCMSLFLAAASLQLRPYGNFECWKLRSCITTEFNIHCSFSSASAFYDCRMRKHIVLALEVPQKSNFWSLCAASTSDRGPVLMGHECVSITSKSKGVNARIAASQVANASMACQFQCSAGSSYCTPSCCKDPHSVPI